jgi:hypothetical protein
MDPYRRRQLPGALTISDRGDIVLGWLMKMVFFFGLAGIVAFDGLSIMITHVAMMDDAKAAAIAAADVLARNPSKTNIALAASEREAAATHSTIAAKSWFVDSAGTVHLTLQKEVDSMLAKHIGPLRKYLVVTVSESAAPVR